MTISYTKTNWKNNITPLSATNMNHIEDGIETVVEAINNFEAAPTYQHHIGFRITAGSDELYIQLDVYSTDSTAITSSTLYKYIQKNNYPVIGGTIINAYSEAVAHADGLGLGRMSYDLDGTGRPIYLFFAYGGSHRIESNTLEGLTISNFVDTIRKI